MSIEEMVEAYKRAFAAEYQFVASSDHTADGTSMEEHYRRAHTPTCECGAAKCNTTHSTWCPVFK